MVSAAGSGQHRLGGGEQESGKGQGADAEQGGFGQLLHGLSVCVGGR